MAREKDIVLDVIINGEKATANLKELTTTSKQLWKEIQSLTPGTDAFIKKAEEIKKVDGQMKAVRDSVKGLNGTLVESGSSFKGLWVDIAKGGATLQAFNAVADATAQFFTNSIAEATNAEKANRMLQNTLRNYDKEEYFDAITADAELLARTFSYLDNDDIVASQEKLVLYGKITRDEMSRILELAIELSARIGVSLPDATGMLIKALEGNSKPLKEFGINMKDGGNETERMQILLGELAPKLAGSARNFENSSEGIAASTRKMRADMEEELGNKLIPLLNKFYQVLNRSMDGIKYNFADSDTKIQMRADAIAKQTNAYALQSATITSLQSRANKAVLDGKMNETQANEWVLGQLKQMESQYQKTYNEQKKLVEYLGTKDLNLPQIETAAQAKASLDALNLARNKMVGSGSDNLKFNSGNRDDDPKATAAALEKSKKQAEEKKAQLEKQMEERRKMAEKLEQDLLTIEQQAATAQLQLIKDEFEKEKQLEFDRSDNEVKGIQAKLDKLKAEGATLAQIETAKNSLIETEHANHMNRLAAIEKKHEEDIAAKRKKSEEEALKNKELAYNTELELMNQAFDKTSNAIAQNELEQLSTTEDTEQQHLQIKSEFANQQLLNEEVRLEALIKLQQKYGASSIDNERKLTDLRKELYTKDVEAKRRAEELKQQIGTAALGFFKDLIAGEIDMLSQTEESRKKNANKIRNLQYAQVYLDGIQEVASIWQNVQRIDNSGGNVYYAQILGAILTAASITRTGFALNKISGAKFYGGGHTGPGIGVNDNQGAIAGIVHSNEWVAPQWMTQSPTYAPVINWLETSRLKGYMSGGFTTTPTPLAVGMAASGSTSEFQALRQDLAMYTYAIQNWKKTVYAHVSATEADSEIKQLDVIKQTFQIL